MSDFFSWLFTTDHLQDFSILMLCFCIVMAGRASERHTDEIAGLRRDLDKLTRRCSACADTRSARAKDGGGERTE